MKEKVKITYVISGLDFSLGFLWLSKHIDPNKYEVSYIFLSKSAPALHSEFLNNGLDSTFYSIHSKRSYFKILLKLFVRFIKNRPTIVHAHLFEAGLLSMFASTAAFIKRRIYTRHHATYNSVYFPHMVKYDRLINTLASHLVAISNNVSEVLINAENVSPSKISLIPHGFQFDEFIITNPGRIEKLRESISLIRTGPTVGVISRHIELKGLQYIIPAFKKYLKDYPEATLVLANAVGNYKDEIKKTLETLPKESYIEIEFEKDLFSLYALFDLFIHVPIDSSVEAFGQVYVEALAAGIPSIFTLSGIAPDFIQHEKNALVVPYKNIDAIYDSMLRYSKDSTLKQTIIKQGREDVIKGFSFENSLDKMYKLYEY